MELWSKLMPYLQIRATVTVATLYHWFSAISFLARWGREHIYFLSDEE
jgi:hypothetical protein